MPLAINVVPGHIVKSVQGRDIGQIYIVLEVKNPPFVLVADGRGRTMQKPKRKNIRHMKLGSVANEVAAKLKSGAKITDLELRQAIMTSPDIM